jgi:hypothetical protein
MQTGDSKSGLAMMKERTVASLGRKKPGPMGRRRDREGACLSRGMAVEDNGHK